MRKSLIVAAFFGLIMGHAAEARLTRVVVAETRPLPVKAGQPAYELVSGIFHGELDPRALPNRIITDLERAPRNARGRVEYSATFAVARPIDASKASGLLFYEVPNRGFGAVSSDPDGHIRVISGWQGDIAPAKGVQTASVPTARGISGAVLTRMVNIAAGAKSIAITGGIGRPMPRPDPVSLDTRKAHLVTQRRGAPDALVAPGDWAFADCGATPFPGTPDPHMLCLRGGFDPDAAYVCAILARIRRCLAPVLPQPAI
jgi:hypothetical protein